MQLAKTSENTLPTRQIEHCSIRGFSHMKELGTWGLQLPVQHSCDSIRARHTKMPLASNARPFSVEIDYEETLPWGRTADVTGLVGW